jgi:ACS family tartrate transporter-like MFS transporter
MGGGEAIGTAPRADDPELAGRVFRRVAWRLVPFLCLLYICNLLDRGNVGFARVAGMEDDLHINQRLFDLARPMMHSDAETRKWLFDWAIGLFYFGYLLFEVPSNLLLRWTGARRWMARIMVTWGLVTCLTMLVSGLGGFILLRVLLGVAEAGFFPGIVLYLSYWFPSRERAQVMAYFMAANAIATLVGNPLAGAITQGLDGVAGLEGWRWLFLLEGLPSVLVGFSVFWFLTDRPEEAHWLADDERRWLVERMNWEEQYRKERHGADLLRAMIDWRVWLLIALYFTVALGSNAASAYFPKLIDAQFEGLSRFQLGLVAAVPPACGFLAMIVWSIHSDRTGERRVHVALAAFLGAAGWALSAGSSSPWLVLAGFCLAQMGMLSMLPTFWSLPTSFLSGAAAAGGIALINSVGNVGGLLGAPVLGLFGQWSLVAALGVGGVLALCVRHDPTLDRGRVTTKTA